MVEDRIIQDVIIFENKIRRALEIKYQSLPNIPLEAINHFIFKSCPIDIRKFIELYKIQKMYSLKLLENLVNDLMDIKFQIILYQEFHLGLYNLLVNFPAHQERTSTSNNPYLLLRQLSLDQDNIVKSRIIWERIMKFIYYLERGKELKHKSAFFKLIEEKKSPWNFFGQYKLLLEEHDENFRNPEIHRSSVLRECLINNTLPDGAKILKLANTAFNVFWNNLTLILEGSPSRIIYSESS